LKILYYFLEKLLLIYQAKKAFGNDYIFVPKDLDRFLKARFTNEAMGYEWRVMVDWRFVDYNIYYLKLSGRDLYIIPSALFD